LILKQNIITFFIILVVFTLLNLPFSNTLIAQSDFTSYSNPFLDTTMNYLSDWSYLFNEKAIVFFPMTDNFSIDGALLIVEHPVVIPPNVDWSQITKVTDDYIMMQKNDFNLLNTSSSSDSGIFGQTYIYTYNNPNLGKTLGIHTFVNSGNYLSSVGYETANPSNLALHQSTLDKIISSYASFLEMLESDAISPLSSSQPIVDPTCDINSEAYSILDCFSENGFPDQGPMQGPMSKMVETELGTLGMDAIIGNLN
jgi:hypothetical protein